MSGRWSRLAAFATLVVGAVFASPGDAHAAPTRRALVIGIDTYAPPPGTKPKDSNRNWPDLDGAANDARSFASLLTDRYGFQKGEVRVLANREATRDAILDSMDKWLLADAKKDDVRVFYFAGHGSQVPNSRSHEPDHLDETIVPADGSTGAADIRDKELGRRFAHVTSAGIKLTVVLDSCHSGSGTRGALSGRKVRMIARGNVDALDGGDDPNPVDGGALVLSAAQDIQLAEEDQDEAGKAHGAFTLALLRALRSRPVDEGIDIIYRKTRGLMQAGGRTQEPVLGASESRKHLSLLGDTPKPGKQSVLIAVGEVQPGSDEVLLQGGYAEGLAEGCELVREGAPGKDSTRVKITEVRDLGRSVAKVVAKGAKPLKAGDLLQVDRWVMAPERALSVWVSTAPSVADVERLAAEARGLAGRSEFTLATDPALRAPTHVIRWTKEQGWLMETSGETRPLGKTLSADAVAATVKGKGPRPIVFVALPVPAELAGALAIGPKSSNDGIIVVPDRDRGRAIYQLTGIARSSGIEYAWLLPGASDDTTIPLPVRTDWVGGDPATAARTLTGFAVTLARVQAWASLKASGQDDFPYHLRLNVDDGGKKSAVTGRTTGGAVREKSTIKVSLEADGNPNVSEARYVYVFAIDSHGNGVLLYPTGEKVENRYPLADPPPKEIPLPITVSVVPPFGVDTYYLLTSREQIPDPYVLEWSGVRRRGLTRGAASPLQSLLARVGTRTRGFQPDPPTDWDIEHISVKSIPLPLTTAAANQGDQN